MRSSPPAPVESVLDTIGNTPVVKLRHVVPKDCADVYVKLEFLNPSGCYKDRMAKAMIEQAERRGELKSGMTVVEATGGSTGSALALVCAVKGYKFLALSSNVFAVEKLRTISAFGAKMDLTPGSAGEVPADLMSSLTQRAAKLCDDDANHFYTNQFHNRDALLGYQEIGYELLKQFPDGFDAFCGAVGTAGMVMGVATVVKPRHPASRIVVLEPASSPVITQGRAGTHGVDGIAPGFVPPHLDASLYDEARAVDEREARAMCCRLAAEEGLLVGTSSGINIVAALQLAKELGPGKKVVTIATDTGLKYLAGHLFPSAE